MAESVNKLRYVIELDTTKGTASINGAVVSLDKLDDKLRQISKSAKKMGNDLKDGTDKTGLAGAAVIELSRGISDLNYGVTAVANNFSQLMTLMSTLVVTTGSLKNALTAMWAVMKGPLGVVFLFQILTTIIEKLAIDSKKAAEKIGELEAAIASAGTELSVYLATAKNVSTKHIELIELEIEALKRKAKFQKMISDLEELKEKKAVVEKTEAKDMVDWWSKQAIRLKNVLNASFMWTGGQSAAEIEKEGGLLKKIAVGNFESQITDMEIEFDRQAEDFGKYMEDKLNSIFEEDDKDKGGKKQPKQSWLYAPGEDAVTGIIGASPEEITEALSQLLFIHEYKQALLKEEAEEDEKARAAAKERREKDLEHRLMMWEAIGSGMQSLGFILGKTTETGKAVAAAGALIDTYATIMAQLKNASKLGIPGPIAIAQAVATGLFGFAQVKKIYDVKVPKGSGGGGAAGGVPSDIPIQQPDFNIVGVTRQNQLRSTITDALGKPVRAYITTKDVRSGAELDRNIVRGASVG